jgi:ankyrin repeat protein
MKSILIIIFIILNINVYSQKIFKYISDGNINKVQEWINNGEDINNDFSRKNEDGQKLSLHVFEWAAFFNRKEILDLFILNKEKFKYYNKWISDALAANIHNCDPETIHKLLNAGASVNNLCRMCNNASPLSISIAYSCDSIYKILITKNPNVSDKNAGYDLIHAAAGYSSLDTLKSLISRFGLNINSYSKDSDIPPTFYAAEYSNFNNLKYLIENGAVYNIQNSKGLYILNFVTNLEIFVYLEKLLSKEGRLENKFHQKGIDPIIFSIISSDNKELFDYYIDKYPEYVDDYTKETVSIHQVVYAKDNGVYFLNRLLEKGLKIDKIDKYGRDLKYYAKQMKRKDILKSIKEYKKRSK